MISTSTPDKVAAKEIAQNIMSNLASKPKGKARTAFNEGKGFVQHDPKKVRAARITLLRQTWNYVHDADLLTARMQEITQENNSLVDHKVNTVYGSKLPYALKQAWRRMILIDSQGREWSQISFLETSNSQN